MIWAASARRDIIRLHAFLAERDPDAADRAVDTITDSVNILGDNPRIGRRVGTSDYLREWPVLFGNSGYVVRYRLDFERISLLQVRHMREQGFAGR